jgi:hypothetical protein
VFHIGHAKLSAANRVACRHADVKGLTQRASDGAGRKEDGGAGHQGYYSHGAVHQQGANAGASGWRAIACIRQLKGRSCCMRLLISPRHALPVS